MTTTSTSPGPMLALPPGGHDKPKNVLSLASLLLGASATMVASGLLAAYLNVRALTRVWPPKAAELDNYLGTTLLITLLLSALVVEWAPYAIKQGNRRQGVWALIMTAGFGAAFLILAWYTLRQAGFGPADHAFGTLFYAFYAAVIAHAAAAMAYVLVALARTLGHQVTSADRDVVRGAAWFWQTLVVTWLIAFTALYVFQHK